MELLPNSYQYSTHQAKLNSYNQSNIDEKHKWGVQNSVNVFPKSKDYLPHFLCKKTQIIWIFFMKL